MSYSEFVAVAAAQEEVAAAAAAPAAITPWQGNWVLTLPTFVVEDSASKGDAEGRESGSGEGSGLDVQQIKIDAVVDSSGFIDQGKRNDSLEAAQRDVYNEVVNCHLVGPALGYLYDKCLEVVKKGQLLFTIGGDHSIATATIAASSQVHKDLCVIWIDAHADANTPETSPSLHYHGMPVAHLLGWFKRHPTGFQEWMPDLRCLREQNFAYIGLRDIDPVE